jgi:catechol 2,3-dioxygenase-like lactoylglutathione lyase family enzyme
MTVLLAEDDNAATETIVVPAQPLDVSRRRAQDARAITLPTKHMRNSLFLVIGIFIGAAAATVAGQPRDIVGLNHVAIAVPAADFDNASAFYTDVLGLPRAFAFREADGSPYLSYFQINRSTFVELMPVTPQRPAGFVHFGLEVDNVDAIVNRLRARGVKVGDASVSARTKSKIAVAHTPDGSAIELMEFGPDSLHRKVMNDWRR